MDWTKKLFGVSPGDSSGALKLVIVSDAPSAWLPNSYGSCRSLVRHEAYCYIARKAGRDERRLSLDLMPNQSPKGRYGKIAWQKTSGRA